METSFLRAAAPLLEVVLIMLALNSRMMFYGLSFLDKFRGLGPLGWYLTFALTDETYALLCATECPKDVEEKFFMAALSGLNHSYWICGGIIGVVAGTLLPFDATGVDFIMTALFVVLAADQWRAYKSHEPVVIGFAASLLALAFLGPDRFMIPALVLITAALAVRRKSIDGAAG
jgi:4-azaleucine resistance transporter AzlC